MCCFSNTRQRNTHSVLANYETEQDIQKIIRPQRSKHVVKKKYSKDSITRVNNKREIRTGTRALKSISMSPQNDS